MALWSKTSLFISFLVASNQQQRIVTRLNLYQPVKFKSQVTYATATSASPEGNEVNIKEHGNIKTLLQCCHICSSDSQCDRMGYLQQEDRCAIYRKHAFMRRVTDEYQWNYSNKIRKEIKRVNGNINLAARKETHAHSIYDDHGPELAIDGGKETPYCFYSAHYAINPWWRIDLQDVYLIDHMIFYLRLDCCNEREVNTDFFVGNSLLDNGNTNPICRQGVNFRILSTQTNYIECDTPRYGRYVNILSRSNSNLLQVCELEVYSFVRLMSYQETVA